VTDLWPEVNDDAALDALHGQSPRLTPGLTAIAALEGWPATPLEHFADGSLPCFAIDGGRVLKLYPPRWNDDFVIESAVLDHLDGKVAAPRLVTVGALEGWAYLAMTRLPGQALHTVWDSIPRDQQLRLGADVGRWVAELHAIPSSDLALPRDPWPRFHDRQRGAAADEQRRLGLDPRWVDQIDTFLDSVSGLRDAPQALVHTEVMREHTFVEERAGHWQLVGLLDYEPAMVAAREYEFASVGIFLAAGDAPLLRAALLAYGYTERDLDAELQRRLMAHAILHRYSHLGWYLQRMPPADDARTLDDLAAHWFRL